MTEHLKDAPTKNKCEEAGFQHAWENTTSDLIFPTYPATYLPREERCRNCGLRRVFYSKTEKWMEYSDGRRFEFWENENSAILINNSGIL